jgi:hypothetical protein
MGREIERASAAHCDAGCDMALLFIAVAGELDREDGDGGRRATACFLANRERACAAEVVSRRAIRCSWGCDSCAAFGRHSLSLNGLSWSDR